MARAIKATPSYTGPAQVDKTPGTVPASLAALETAVPAAGQPADERWQAAYGTFPDLQVATVLGGAWVDADVDAGAAMTGATGVAAGTAGTVPAPNTAQDDLVLHGDGLWRQPIPNWTANTHYSTGAIAYQNQVIWRRATAGTSGLTFNATEQVDWVAMADATDGLGVQMWATGTSYDIDDLVIESDRLYRATALHVAGATFTGDAANWVEVSGGTAANITEGTLNAATANRAVDLGGFTVTVDNAGEATIRSPGTIGATAARLFLDGADTQRAYLESIDGAGFRQSAAEVTGSNVNLYSAQTTLREAGGQGAPELRMVDDADVNYVGFKAPPAVATSQMWTLPAADGANGEMLATNGAGLLSWAAAPVDQFVPTADGQTLAVGTKYLIATAHNVTLPALTAGIDGQYITMVAPGAWDTQTGAITTTGGDTLEPASGLPMGSRDILTLVASFGTGQWLVRVGGDPTPELALSFDTVAALPDPTTVSAGTQASVTNDGASTGVYVATGTVGGPGTGWVRS